MGSVFVLISFFIQTDMINTQSILISIPIAILVGAINLSNNIRDIEEDKKGGRKTLAILMGHKGACYSVSCVVCRRLYLGCRFGYYRCRKPMAVCRLFKRA